MSFYRRRSFYAKQSPAYNQEIQQNFYTTEEKTDPGIVSTIEKLLENTSLTAWEKEFLSSIKIHFVVKKQLSDAQYKHYSNIQSKYNPEKILAEEEFVKNFTPAMKEDLKIIAEWYIRTNSPYHSKLIKAIMDDADYIPSHEKWNKLMNNSYSLGYLRNYKNKPKFNIGTPVRLSKVNGRDPAWPAGIIIDNSTELPITHAVGGKRYVVLPYGHTNTVIVEERQLRKI